MIGYLEGTIVHTTNSYLIINVGGVGYKVFAVPELLSHAPGTTTSLYVYHKSSDDGQALFGLPSPAALDFFDMLLSVSGVGPKTALSVLSAGDMAAQKEAISSGDATFFSQMGGVGKKTAERIIVELKDKVGALGHAQTITGGSGDVFDALVGLGYSTQEVRRIMPNVDRALPAAEQLKQALKLLAN